MLTHSDKHLAQLFYVSASIRNAIYCKWRAEMHMKHTHISKTSTKSEFSLNSIKPKLLEHYMSQIRQKKTYIAEIQSCHFKSDKQ